MVIQKRFDELGWTHREYNVMSQLEYQEAIEEFYRAKGDSAVQHEEIDVSNKSLDETKGVFLGLKLEDTENFKILWLYDRFGARIELKNFVANLNSLWYPSQNDVILTGKNTVIELNHEERILVYSHFCGFPIPQLRRV